jgi:leucyl/phenylalanyl-tRNA--protein transferase
MFSSVRDASKIALVHLAARLIHGGFSLLDTQFVTDHLRQFGTIEVEKTEFHARLDEAIEAKADFMALPLDAPPQLVLEIIARAGAWD